MHFVKAEGLGNDFVILDGYTQPIPDHIADLTKKLCDRHFGIGADGVLLVEKSQIADIKMRIINGDGSEAQMCGNGIRCVAVYAYGKGWVKKKMTVETLAGVLTPEIISLEPALVRVDMGEPILNRAQIPMSGEGTNQDILHVKEKDFAITALSMGNPHCVIFCDTIENLAQQYGKDVEYHPLFPEKTNVEFVQIINTSTLRMQVWERGAAITLACGTGACATVVAGVQNNLCERKTRVLLDGGELEIEWEKESNHVFMTGTAKLVFEGEWLL